MAKLKKKAAAVAGAVAGIYADIVKVLGEAAQRQKGETAIAYIERVGTVMGASPDEVFAQFSPATAEWFDAMVEAVNANKPTDIPELTGFPVDEAPAPAAQPAAPAATPASASPSAPAAGNEKEQEPVAKKKPVLKKKAAAAAPAKKPAKAAKKPVVKKSAKKTAAPKQTKLPGTGEGGKARVDGVSYKIRLAVVKKPTISFEDACAKAGADAVAGGHAHNMWNHARLIMQIVEAEAAK